MSESRLHASANAWFPPTPPIAETVRARLPATPDSAPPRRRRRRTLGIALAALLLTGAALAASSLDLVPGVRIQRVERLPEIPYSEPPAYGAPTALDDARRAVPFEIVLPEGLGEPDQLLLDHDRSGSGVVTAVYGVDDGARLVLTQWAGGPVLFDKLLTFDASAQFVDVDGAPGIWIEDDEHAVFYGRLGDEDRVGGYLSGNVLVWQRGTVTYRIEAGVPRDVALELARSLRPA
jgi:hypothetical protein